MDSEGQRARVGSRGWVRVGGFVKNSLRVGAGRRGTGGWCRGGLVAAWRSLGREADTRGGARDREVRGRGHKVRGGSNAALLFSSFLNNFAHVCIYSWLCWVFTAAGLSSSGGEWGCSRLRRAGPGCADFSGLGSRLQGTGSVLAALGLCRSAARGISPDQGSNLCLLHWQAGSLPRIHQGSPLF